jgi:hypothetical protein
MNIHEGTHDFIMHLPLNNRSHRINTNKGKGVPVHDIKIYKNSRGTAPLIPDFEVKWMVHWHSTIETVPYIKNIWCKSVKCKHTQNISTNSFNVSLSVHKKLTIFNC